ncbi:MAG: L17 family ribosomal protein [Planctomycetia bacterium]|nr:L17 family ribosomal protein [Planctomycetia bacterium]
MRHRRTGKIFGRSPSHQRALLRNLATALILTERDEDDFDTKEMAPKVAGRITTTAPKAKALRPFVERCITIAIKGNACAAKANERGTQAEHGSPAWKKWREGEGWKEWANLSSKSVAARRQLFQILNSKEAVSILCDKIAPRFVNRNGGYTRIMKLATPRLGDGGDRAIIEFVGENDSRKKKAAPKVPSVE